MKIELALILGNQICQRQEGKQAKEQGETEIHSGCFKPFVQVAKRGAPSRKEVCKKAIYATLRIF